MRSVELFQVITVAEAKAILERQWPQVTSEIVTLERALGRVLAEPVLSPLDVPPFTRSTVDGYAVRAADTFAASPALPAYLSLCGRVEMGQSPVGRLAPGGAMALPTGGMLPPGADAAVMVENTEEVDAQTVAVLRPAAPGENLLTRGEDVRAGQVLFPAGHRLRPQDIALLAACGVAQVAVRSPLGVGIVSTGDELVAPGEPLGEGQIYDSNSYALVALTQADGARPRLYGPIKDDPAALREALAQALAENDLVILSGGSSVGVHDLTRTVIEQLGGQLLFHGVAIGPGKPTLAATIGHRLLVGLPGHPGSAVVVYLVLLSPLVGRGTHTGEPHHLVSARLTRSVASRSGREDYLLVRLFLEGGEMRAEPLLGKSGLLSPLVRASGLAIIPLEEEGKAAGEAVQVMLL